MAPGDHRLVFQADAGDAEAQNDIGQLFLLAGKPRAALYWFQQAVQQDNADAMHWLGHCYISGSGVPQDHHVGLMWIAKAAAVGHVIAQGQMTWLIDQAVHK
jgi:TPR repeat protein